MKTTHPYFVTQTSLYHLESLKEPVMNVVGIRIQLVGSQDFTTTSDFVWLNTSLSDRTNARSSTSIINGMKQNYLWLQPYPVPVRNLQIMTEYWEVARCVPNPVYDFDLTFRSINGIIPGPNFKLQWLIYFDTVD